MAKITIHLCALYAYSVTQLCLTLCNHTDRNPPGSSVHGIFQARILEQEATSFSRGSSQPRNQTQISCVSCTGGQILFTTEPPGKPYKNNGCILTNKDFLFIDTWGSTWTYHIVSNPL